MTGIIARRYSSVISVGHISGWLLCGLVIRCSYLKNGSHAGRYFVIEPPTANRYISVTLIPVRRKSPLGTVLKNKLVAAYRKT